MVNSESQLVVIVPTHNRIEKLTNCLQSIRSTYGTVSIVVGDNSDEDYEKFGSLIEEKFSVEVLDLRHSSGCIGSTYQALIHRC
jgi:GT2 family glycosyltransferase